MLEMLGEFLKSAANPAILFFLIGLLATLLRVELPIPGGFKAVLTVYLMAAIGFKGGAAVAEAGLAAIWFQAVVLALLAALIPLWVYPLARFVGRVSAVDAAALAAHYGSVSAVTYATAQNQLAAAGIPFEAAAPAFLAVMEVPGILTALALFQMHHPRPGREREGIWPAVREVLRSKSVFVLLASLVAGYLTGKPGLDAVAGFFVTPFQGVLTLFLLEMGLEAGRKLTALRQAGVFLIVFALTLPLLNGALGVLTGRFLGLSAGGMALVGILAGSASYIAAPAAVRVKLPEANPGLYLTAALGITFPFNLVFGIPLIIVLAHTLAP